MQHHYSIQGSYAAQAITLVAFAFVAATTGSFSPTTVQAAGSIEESYNLPTEENVCIEFGTVTFSATDGAPEHRVYKLNDVWHQIHPCLKFLKGEVSKRAVNDPLYDFTYYQMLYVLSQSEVKFYDKSDKKMTLKNLVNKEDKLDLSKIKRVTYTGDKGQAYDGMGAADFANWTLDMHRIYIAKVKDSQVLDQFGNEQSASYIGTSLAVMETIVTPVDKGGLRSTSTCAEKVDGKTAKCSWFHSKTSDDKDPEDGLTLNKTLSVVRDLERYGRDLRKTGSSDLVARAEKFEDYAVEGVNQMVYGKGMKKSDIPTIFDFVPFDKNGDAIQKSWVYYGLSSKETKNGKKKEGGSKGYYLKQTIEKNCGYHKRNISLLTTIFKEMEGEVNIKGFTKKHKDLGNKSILEYMIKSYELKEAGGKLNKNEDTTAPGNFQRCVDETGAEVTPEMFAYLRSL